MKSLLAKEIKELLSSWLGAIAMLAFSLVSVLFLWVFPDSSYFTFGYASTQLFFEFSYYLLLFIVPALTIGFFSSEFKNGTFEVLSALPVSWGKIIGSKFIAGMIGVIFMLFIAIPSLYVILQIGEESVSELAQIIGSSLGFIWIGGCFVAVSIAISTFFDNASIAFILSVIIGFLLYAGFGLLSSLPLLSEKLQYLIRQLGLQYHGDYLSRGVVPISSIVYLSTIIVLFLLVAQWSLKRKNF